MAMDLAERWGRWVGDFVGAKKGEKQAKKAREDRIGLVDRLDWEPEYASDHAPTYEKTKSPVARAYLESMLLGQNPDATWEGATNAGAIKAAQERTQNNLYGTPAARAAESAEVQQQTPWKVTAPSRPVERLGGAAGPTQSGSLMDLPANKMRSELTTRGVAPGDVDSAVRALLQKYGSLDRALRMVQEGKGGY